MELAADRESPNNAVRGTAARLRFGLNVKGYGSGGGPRRVALDDRNNCLSERMTENRMPGHSRDVL